MTSIFWIGILTVFVAVITGKKEYTSHEDVGSIYRSLVINNAEPLKYALVKPGATVELRKMDTDTELSFCSIEPLGDDLQPGIIVSLPKNGNCCTYDLRADPQIRFLKYFRFANLYVRMIPTKFRSDNSEHNRVLHLEVEFEGSNEKDNDIIKVIMEVFTEPTSPSDVEHARKNKVPRVPYPARRKEFFKFTSYKAVQENSEEPILFNVSWMDKPLKGAKFEYCELEERPDKRIYVFLTGPVIVEDKVYDRFHKMYLEYIK